MVLVTDMSYDRHIWEFSRYVPDNINLSFDLYIDLDLELIRRKLLHDTSRQNGEEVVLLTGSF